MVIKEYYSPSVSGEPSGEAMIFKRGVGPLLQEIRQCILKTKLIISSRKTTYGRKGNKGRTGIPGLAEAMNKALGASLSSLGWRPRKAPGAADDKAEVDWFKSIPGTLSYGPPEIGLGLEVQFGNNYQFNEDIKRLSEAFLEQSIIAGVCVVPSDELAKYKADRGASFGDARSKLDRTLAILQGSGAAIVPGFVLIGIQQDDFTDKQDGQFQLEAPIFDPKKGCQRDPVKYEHFGTRR